MITTKKKNKKKDRNRGGFFYFFDLEEDRVFSIKDKIVKCYLH